MKVYLRRLWAALCGRPFTPLGMGQPIVFRAPGGDLYRLEVVGLDYSEGLGEIARLQISASTPAWRLQR